MRTVTHPRKTLAGQILDLAGFSNILQRLENMGRDAIIINYVKTRCDYNRHDIPGSSRSEEILKHPALKPLRHASSTDATGLVVHHIL